MRVTILLHLFLRAKAEIGSEREITFSSWRIESELGDYVAKAIEE
jgi:hypothetical protein